MGFSGEKDVKMSADAPSFAADISATGNLWTASIQYKAGFRVGPPSITATTSDALMGQLMKLDSATKFFRRRITDVNALSAKDSAVLEAMRLDTATVSDAKYRSACRAFGQQPQSRPNTMTVASKVQQPSVSIIEQLAAWPDFQREHAEIFQPPFGDLNVRIIAQYLLDEGNLPSTPATLAQAYRELKAANCFRTANTLTRGMNGDLQIVQPYSHERIVAMRRQQIAEARDAAPAGLSDVDREAWNAVRAKYPQLSVNSAGFKKCCADTILLWAREHVLEAQPELAAANKRGELNRAIDVVIMQWTRNPNLGQGQKTIKDARIWLG